MRLIFTRTDSKVSRFIRWGLSNGDHVEQTSHFAIQDGYYVFDSSEVGANVNFSRTWLPKVEVVWSIDVTGHLTDGQKDTVREKMAAMHGKPYGWFAFAYFIWRGILLKFFKKAFPKDSAWAKDGWNICTEVGSCLPYKLVDPDLDLAITSPDQLYYHIKERLKL